MTTTLRKRITGTQMVALFNENSFIRYFETKQNRPIEELQTYKITLRHGEKEDPKKVIENALKTTKNKI